MSDFPAFSNRYDRAGDPSARAVHLVFELVENFVRGGGRYRASDTAQFEVLMTHFLPRIDVFSRAVVAQKLAPCPHLPSAILEMLVFDHDEVAEPILASAPRLPEPVVQMIAEKGSANLRALLERRMRGAVAASTPATAQPTNLSGDDEEGATPNTAIASAAPAAPPVLPEVANKDQMKADMQVTPIPFFEASSAERRDMLVALTEASDGEGPPPASRDTFLSLLRLLTLRQYDGVAEILADVLTLPAALARRIVDDQHGEALVAIGRYLGLEEDQFLRLVLLGNTQAGRSVDRVYALRALYRLVSPQAARRLIELWRNGKESPARSPSFGNRRPSPARQSGLGTQTRWTATPAEKEPQSANKSPRK